MTTLVLTLSGVSVRYGRRSAVSEVSWDLGVGFHALLGPNGAGKTSLLRAISTLQPVKAGTVALDGNPVRQVRQRLGFLPQENLGRSRFTVQEHLAYMCWLRQLPSVDVAGEVERVLDLVDLADRCGDRISSLSGGMRRRVGIGSALVGNPSLVVLDEPSAGLDVAQRESLTRVLDRVSEDAIVLVSTHIVEDVLEHADSLTVMDKGRFLFSGPFEQFTSSRDLAAVRDRYMAMVSQ
ncbi:ATP-binding cassette domain-containing protein [Luteococcus sp.]|uniref:ATP-binding cassette domain-containing protein n=1 Tax=Luteococcus sp. TaxID=1969402 RepID=UPI003736CAD8